MDHVPAGFYLDRIYDPQRSIESQTALGLISVQLTPDARLGLSCRLLQPLGDGEPPFKLVLGKPSIHVLSCVLHMYDDLEVLFRSGRGQSQLQTSFDLLSRIQVGADNPLIAAQGKRRKDQANHQGSDDGDNRDPKTPGVRTQPNCPTLKESAACF